MGDTLMDKIFDSYHHGDMFDAYKYLGCHYDKATGVAVFRVRYLFP